MEIEMDLDFPHARWLFYQNMRNMFVNADGRQNFIAEHQRRRRFRRVIIDRMDPFTAMEDEEFIVRFCLRKHTMHSLIQEIQDELLVTHDRKGVPIPPHLQVLIAVASMANGSHQTVIGVCYNVSQTSVSRCLSRVSRGIARLREIYVKFPDANAVRKAVDDFYAIDSMPGVTSCIDCTHIPILRPTCNDSEQHRCRKGYFSLNVQAICDANLLFTNVVARWQGSVHDSRIFENSIICQTLEEGTYQGHLLGDSGYPCRKYLLTPVPTPNDRRVDHQIEAYNRSHVRTRNTIERAFGVLKWRFATLGKVTRTKLDITKSIIVAAVVLHNMAVHTRILQEDYVADVQADEVQEFAPQNARRNIIGPAKREHLIRTYF